MASGNSQPRWDVYEAVLLLEGYLEIMQTNQPKSRIVKRVSDDLRKMAVNRGIIIDDVYRNENGISFQLKKMDSAYRGKNGTFSATKIFLDAVELYLTDKNRYIQTLEKAKQFLEE